MNRIDKKFNELKKQKKKAFIAFITAGDPSLKDTEKLACAFDEAGVDVLELGVPFSDPLADGPTIQASSQRALDKGVTLNKILNTVKAIRRKSEIPIALMTYFNPVFHMGEEAFVEKASKAGVDGLIIPDLPPEEASDLIKAARKNDISTIFFIAPTTTSQRIKKINKASGGFIYYVSLTGVTGARSKLPRDVIKKIKRAKRLTSKPLCVGFGVSTAAQVRAMAKVADGVIVGSAIVNKINCSQRKDLVKNVTRFVMHIKKGM